MTPIIQKLITINLILLTIIMTITVCNMLFSTYLIGINYLGPREIEVGTKNCTPKPFCSN
jgi:hypothetical protein